MANERYELNKELAQMQHQGRSPHNRNVNLNQISEETVFRHTAKSHYETQRQRKYKRNHKYLYAGSHASC